MITCTFENGSQDSFRHVVVGVIIVKDGKVLLTKRGTFKGQPILEAGKWSLTGGYLDRDETAIEGAVRETKEEINLDIKNLKFMHIVDRPDRPSEDRQNVSMTFFAELAGGELKTTEEVTEVEWFGLDNLPPKEEIAFDFWDELQLYRKYLKEDLQIPILD